MELTLPEGYTLVLCVAPSCRVEQAEGVETALRECVRTSQHGVLVVSGCTLGPAACRVRASGPLVVVQPCDTGRRPIGDAIRIGPIREVDDLAVVQDWILLGQFDPALLPLRLTALHRTARAAPQN